MVERRGRGGPHAAEGARTRRAAEHVPGASWLVHVGVAVLSIAACGAARAGPPPDAAQVREDVERLGSIDPEEAARARGRLAAHGTLALPHLVAILERGAGRALEDDAARAIGRLHRDGADALLRLADGGRAAPALVGMLEWRDVPARAPDLVRRRLADPDPRVAARAVRVLWRWSPTADEASATLDRILAAPGEELEEILLAVREVGADAGPLGPRLAALLRTAKGSAPDVLAAIAAVGPRCAGCVDAVRAYVESSDVHAATEAARVLCRLGSDGRRALVGYVRAGPPGPREGALLALAATPDLALEALAGGLAGLDGGGADAVLRLAARHVAALPSAQLDRLASEALERGDAMRRAGDSVGADRLAVSTLELAVAAGGAGRGVPPALAARLPEHAAASSTEVRVAALRAIASGGGCPESWRATLLRAMRDPSPAVRRNAIVAANAAGCDPSTPETLAALRRALDDDDEVVRWRALDWLSDSDASTPEIVARLLDLVHAGAPEARVAARALRCRAVPDAGLCAALEREAVGASAAIAVEIAAAYVAAGGPRRTAAGWLGKAIDETPRNDLAVLAEALAQLSELGEDAVVARSALEGLVATPALAGTELWRSASRLLTSFPR